MKLVQKYSFVNFLADFEIGAAYELSERFEGEECPNKSDANWTIAFVKGGKSEIFPVVLTLSIHPSLTEFGHFHSYQN